jgi:ribonuclease HII
MAKTKDTLLRKIVCGFEYENQAYESGATLIAGLDEVGRGTWFGPVTAAAVILPRDCGLEGLRDSKLISPKKRKRIAEEIKARAVAWSVAHVEAAEIDRSNIAAATEMAMYEAVHGLNVMPDYLLIDAIAVDIPILQTSIYHGDAVSGTIAAASIVAKVTRDELMVELDSHVGWRKSSL